jgi:hypothetical protein
LHWRKQDEANNGRLSVQEGPIPFKLFFRRQGCSFHLKQKGSKALVPDENIGAAFWNWALSLYLPLAITLG